jgi:hypothetical protein
VHGSGFRTVKAGQVGNFAAGQQNRKRFANRALQRIFFVGLPNAVPLRAFTNALPLSFAG